MSGEIKNLFISHVHEDDAELQGLKDLLGRNGYEIRDGSIDSSKPNEANNPEYIKYEVLAPKIQWAGAFLVLISPRTCESLWVEWEIQYAQQLGKRIVGVYVQGGQESDLPENFQKYGDSIVGWQAEKVMDAIEGRTNDWVGPDGVTPSQERAISRYSCSK